MYSSSLISKWRCFDSSILRHLSLSTLSQSAPGTPRLAPCHCCGVCRLSFPGLGPGRPVVAARTREIVVITLGRQCHTFYRRHLLAACVDVGQGGSFRERVVNSSVKFTSIGERKLRPIKSQRWTMHGDSVRALRLWKDPPGFSVVGSCWLPARPSFGAPLA